MLALSGLPGKLSWLPIVSTKVGVDRFSHNGVVISVKVWRPSSPGMIRAIVGITRGRVEMVVGVVAARSFYSSSLLL